MKKILFVMIFAAAVCNTANAQTDQASATKTMTKAEKEAAKAKKEADLVEAFNKAGLSAELQSQCRYVLDESNARIKPIKTDASLTEEARKEKLDAIYKERNDKLKAIMGDASYKTFKATQKAQKEAAGNAG